MKKSWNCKKNLDMKFLLAYYYSKIESNKQKLKVK